MTEGGWERRYEDFAAGVIEQSGIPCIGAGDELQPARPYGPGAFVVESNDEAYRFLENEHGDVWAAFSGMRTLRRSG